MRKQKRAAVHIQAAEDFWRGNNWAKQAPVSYPYTLCCHSLLSDSHRPDTLTSLSSVQMSSNQQGLPWQLSCTPYPPFQLYLPYHLPSRHYMCLIYSTEQTLHKGQRYLSHLLLYLNTSCMPGEWLNEWVSWILKDEQWISQLKDEKEKGRERVDVKSL